MDSIITQKKEYMWGSTLQRSSLVCIYNILIFKFYYIITYIVIIFIKVRTENTNIIETLRTLELDKGFQMNAMDKGFQMNGIV